MAPTDEDDYYDDEWWLCNKGKSGKMNGGKMGSKSSMSKSSMSKSSSKSGGKMGKSSKSSYVDCGSSSSMRTAESQLGSAAVAPASPWSAAVSAALLLSALMWA